MKNRDVSCVCGEYSNIRHGEPTIVPNEVNIDIPLKLRDWTCRKCGNEFQTITED